MTVGRLEGRWKRKAASKSSVLAGEGKSNREDCFLSVRAHAFRHGDEFRKIQCIRLKNLRNH